MEKRRGNQKTDPPNNPKSEPTHLEAAWASWGKPQEVQDAAGHIFWTDFDGDGLVQDVKLGGQAGTNVVTYNYGLANDTITNGQVTDVTDNLSGVTDHLAGG